MTQIQRAGYIVVDLTVLRAAPDKFKQRSPIPDDCQRTWASFTPAVVSGYTLSFDPTACGGPSSRFAPVTWPRVASAPDGPHLCRQHPQARARPTQTDERRETGALFTSATIL